jgi:hypothetical protein
MATQKIPCSDCEDKKVEIELGGRYRVTGCEPIDGQDGWCRITYVRVTGGAPAKTLAAKNGPVKNAAASKRVER